MGERRYFIPKSMVKFEYEGVVVNYPGVVCNLYFRELAPKYLQEIVQKWEKGRQLSDRDYSRLLKKAFAHPHRWRDLPDTDDLMELCGLEMSGGNLRIRGDARQDVEIKALRCFIEHILAPHTKPILHKYFPNQEINFEVWETQSKDAQDLDHTVKIAYIFTLYNYFWNEEAAASYNFFLDYYCNELDKRISFVKQLWDHRRPGEGLEYIPIFDDVRNLNPETGAFVSQVVARILKSQTVKEAERKIIERALIDHAKKILQYPDEWGTAVRESLLTPLVSEVVSLNKSREFIQAANLCLQNGLYNSAINRCYYAMLRAARAALASFGHYRPWRDANLRPVETHEGVITSFAQVLVEEQKLLSEKYAWGLRKVYRQRLLADYADDELEEKSAREVLNMAQEFVDRIEDLLA